jgi:hypothetical protein
VECLILIISNLKKVRRTKMPKFLIDVELDGYDTEEEMLSALNSEVIHEALRDYGFSVIKIETVQDT